MTVATLSVRIDGGIVCNIDAGIENDKMADAEYFAGLGSAKGKNHRGLGIGSPVFRLGEQAWDLVDEQLKVWPLDDESKA